MGNDCAVKFFGAKSRLTPAEKENCGRAARDQLIGKHAQHTGAHERIDVLPAYVAGFLFHDPKTFVAVGSANAGFLKGAEHVDFAGEFGGASFENTNAFDGNEIDDFGEIEMIETMEQRTQVGGDRAVGREFVQNVGLDFHELNDGIAAETAPVQNEGRVVDGRRRHWHGNLVPTGDNLAPVAEAHEFVHALDGLKFCFEPAVPVAPGIFVEAGFGEMAADAVVDLPGDELGMLAQGLSHGGDDAFGMVPIGFGIEANGAASAFVANQATFVNRQNFGMFLSEPNGRCGSGSGKNDLDAGPAENVHYPAKPAKVAFGFFRLADAPGEFANADDVDAGGGHQLRIALPCGLGIVGGSSVRINPLLRMIINTEIHRYAFRARRSSAI